MGLGAIELIHSLWRPAWKTVCTYKDHPIGGKMEYVCLGGLFRVDGV